MKCTVEHRIKMSKSPIFRNIWCNTLGLIFRQMWVFCVSGPGHPAAAATTGVKWKLQMQNPTKIHYYHVRRWGKCWLPIQMSYVSAMGKNIRHLLYGAVTTGLQEIKGSRHATGGARLAHSRWIHHLLHWHWRSSSTRRGLWPAILIVFVARIAYLPPSAGAH